MTVEERYQEYKSIKRDIDEHLENLYELALECDSIFELGANIGTVTSAFLRAKPKYLLTVDIDQYNEALTLLETARVENPDSHFEYWKGDSREAICDNYDFLFIDTAHNGPLIREELRIHGNKANKYIGFHDTQSFRFHGEHTEEGIWPPIEEFLRDNPHWVIYKDWTHQNGVTILKRVE